MNAKVIFKLSYGLYVLTARDDKFQNGCIINTAMQVTSSPNRISITVNKANMTHDMVLKTKEFNISTIDTTADFGLFKHFGFQSGKNVNKFEDFHGAKQASNGIYYLDSMANGFISAKVINTVDLGSHTLFIADVTDGEVLSDKPSVTYAYYQENIKPKPEKEKKTGWVCSVCGYVYEGEELPDDFICPVCKHGAADFVKL